jgi:hypothetical protein
MQYLSPVIIGIDKHANLHSGGEKLCWVSSESFCVPFSAKKKGFLNSSCTKHFAQEIEVKMHSFYHPFTRKGIADIMQD